MCFCHKISSLFCIPAFLLLDSCSVFAVTHRLVSFTPFNPVIVFAFASPLPPPLSSSISPRIWPSLLASKYSTMCSCHFVFSQRAIVLQPRTHHAQWRVVPAVHPSHCQPIHLCRRDLSGNNAGSEGPTGACRPGLGLAHRPAAQAGGPGSRADVLQHHSFQN